MPSCRVLQTPQHARTHTPAYTSIVGTRIIKYVERVTREWMIRSRDWCFRRDSSDYVFYFDRRLLRITWMIVKLEIVANHKRPACITHRIAEHDHHHRVTACALSIKNILFNRSSLIEALCTESFAFLPKKKQRFRIRISRQVFKLVARSGTEIKINLIRQVI